MAKVPSLSGEKVVAQLNDLTPEELLNPELVKAAEAEAQQVAEQDTEQRVDPREGVADARGATERQPAAGRSGGRRKATFPARERDGRSRR